MAKQPLPTVFTKTSGLLSLALTDDATIFGKHDLSATEQAYRALTRK